MGRGQRKGVLVCCCGFPVARARYYAQFPVVEVQQTFYDLPMAATARRWRQEAPGGFEFTIKAWQLITHEASSPTYQRLRKKPPARILAGCGSFKPTAPVMDAWRRTDEIRRALGARILLFQCPASFAPAAENKENLRTFFNTIERDALICAWEPRGSWEHGEIQSLCRELDLVRCVDRFKDQQAHGEIACWRLHGIGGYAYKYGDEDLATLARRLEGKKGYCLFNNAAMFEDAKRMRSLLRQSDTET